MRTLINRQLQERWTPPQIPLPPWPHDSVLEKVTTRCLALCLMAKALGTTQCQGPGRGCSQQRSHDSLQPPRFLQLLSLLCKNSHTGTMSKEEQ